MIKWEFRQECIDGSHMERRHKLFKFGEQDADQAGDRRFELSQFFYLIKAAFLYCGNMHINSV